MKKLLSLLSVLTISGSAVPTTIAASPYQKQENSEINYQQTNNKSISPQLANNNNSWWEIGSALWGMGYQKFDEFKDYIVEKSEIFKNILENLTINDMFNFFEKKLYITIQPNLDRIEINLNVPAIEQRVGHNYCLAASIEMIFSYFNRNIVDSTENNGHGYSQDRIYIDNTSCGGTGCDISQSTAYYMYNVLQQHMSDTINNYNNQDFIFNSIPATSSDFTNLQQQFFATYVLESLYNNVPVIFAYFDHSLGGWHSIVINSISVNQNDFSDATFNYIDPNGANHYSFDTNILQNYLSQGGFLIGGSNYVYNNEMSDLQYYDFDLASHDGNLNYPQFDHHSLDDVMSWMG